MNHGRTVDRTWEKNNFTFLIQWKELVLKGLNNILILLDFSWMAENMKCHWMLLHLCFLLLPCSPLIWDAVKVKKKVNKSHHHFQLKKQRNLGICKFKTNAWECTANSTYQFISCSRPWVKKFIIYFHTDTISWLQLNLTIGLTFWKNDKHCGTFEMPGCEQCFCLQVILPYLAITVSSINLSLPGYIFPTFKNLFALKVVSSKASASPEGRCKGCMHQDWDA